jgi:nitrate/TMAO reductase-like tetraheme cytochrome c subunit
MNDNDENKPARDKQKSERWQKLWRRPRKWYWFGIPAGGFVMFVVGILFWGGFHTAMEVSNSLAFCTSCHAMAPVYEEYQQSVHYQNASGVRAICADCHVPKAWGPKIIRKMRASLNELPHWALGTIDTKEKFEAHRADMAERVWAEMRANDSRECRNCHALGTMDLELQDRRAARRHTLERKEEKGETCIDCHQGVAHALPEGY